MHSIIMFVTSAWRLPIVFMPELLFLAVIALTVCVVYKAVFNRYFHPLARYPGPFWGGVTDFYKFYAINSIPTEGLRLHEKHGLYSNHMKLENID